MTSMEMTCAPIDCVGININSVELGAAATIEKPADCAAAAAPEIRHPARARKIRAHVDRVPAYQLRATRSNPEKLGHRKRLAHPKTQNCRRDRNFRRRHLNAVRAPNSYAQLVI